MTPSSLVAKWPAEQSSRNQGVPGVFVPKQAVTPDLDRGKEVAEVLLQLVGRLQHHAGVTPGYQQVTSLELQTKQNVASQGQGDRDRSWHTDL